MKLNRGRALVVEERDIFRLGLQAALTRAGFDTSAAATCWQGIDLAHKTDFDLIVVSEKLKEMTAEGCISELQHVSRFSAAQTVCLYQDIDKEPGLRLVPQNKNGGFLTDLEQRLNRLLTP